MGNGRQEIIKYECATISRDFSSLFDLCNLVCTIAHGNDVTKSSPWNIKKKKKKNPVQKERKKFHQFSSCSLITFQINYHDNYTNCKDFDLKFGKVERFVI